MRFLYAAEFVVGGVIVLLLITQLFWPIMRGRRTWPMFRKQAKLESELAEVEQEQVEQKLAQEVKEAKRAKRHIPPRPLPPRPPRGTK